MRKHTAGPWYEEEGFVLASADGVTVADCHYENVGTIDESELDANARLIAAAPEMAEALHKLITLQAYMNWPDAPAWKEAISALEKAGVIDSPIKKYADFCNRIQEQQRKESDK